MKNIFATLLLLFTTLQVFAASNNVYLVKYDEYSDKLNSALHSAATDLYGKPIKKIFGNEGAVLLNVFFMIDYDSKLCIVNITSTLGSHEDDIISMNRKFMSSSSTVRFENIKSEKECYNILGEELVRNSRLFLSTVKVTKGI